MAAILGQLGVDWKLLLAQGVNFLIVLVVLTVFVWKPLLRIMRARRERIEEGLANAREADARLAAVERFKEERLLDAEKEAILKITAAEKDATRRADEIIALGEQKSAKIIKEGEAVLAARREEQFDELVRDARSIVKSAIAKAAALHPSDIDAALLKEAVGVVEREARV